MSLSALLIPMAVALAISAADAKDSIVNRLSTHDEKAPSKTLAETEGIMTNFKDSRLLYRTLNKHGLKINVIDNNNIAARCSGGVLTYRRSSDDEPYSVFVSEVKNMAELIENIRCLTDEYGVSVQEFTRENVKANLEPNMHIESEEVLEDNSVLLTITIDD